VCRACLRSTGCRRTGAGRGPMAGGPSGRAGRPASLPVPHQFHDALARVLACTADLQSARTRAASHRPCAQPPAPVARGAPSRSAYATMAASGLYSGRADRGVLALEEKASSCTVAVTASQYAAAAVPTVGVASSPGRQTMMLFGLLSVTVTARPCPSMTPASVKTCRAGSSVAGRPTACCQPRAATTPPAPRSAGRPVRPCPDPAPGSGHGPSWPGCPPRARDWATVPATRHPCPVHAAVLYAPPWPGSIPSTTGSPNRRYPSLIDVPTRRSATPVPTTVRSSAFSVSFADRNAAISASLAATTSPQPRVGPAKPLNQRHLGHIGHSKRSSSLAGRDQAPRAPACRSTPQVSTTPEWTLRRALPGPAGIPGVRRVTRERLEALSRKSGLEDRRLNRDAARGASETIRTTRTPSAALMSGRVRREVRLVEASTRDGSLRL
jgi:hypothetical protein